MMQNVRVSDYPIDMKKSIVFVWISLFWASLHNTNLAEKCIHFVLSIRGLHLETTVFSAILISIGQHQCPEAN